MGQRVRSRRQRIVKFGAAVAWVALVGLVLLWQTATYDSAMSVAAEWQFNAIGRYYPVLSYLVIVLALTLPLLLLFGRARPPVGRPIDTALFRSLHSFSRALFGFAGVVAVLAAGVLLSILWLPDDKGPPQDVVLDQAVVLPREGLTRLTGNIAYDRTSAFDEDLIVARRNRRFAPMTAPGTNARDLQFFVELPPATEANRGGVRTMTGVLKRDGLPGEIVRLYRYAGYRVEEPLYVLFTGTRSLRWARLVIAGELLIAAILVGLLGLWQRRRTQKIARLIDERSQA